MESGLVYAAIAAFFSAGAAWGAVKTGLNGTKGKVESLTVLVNDHIKDETKSDQVTHERIARVEAKVDIIIDKMV